MKFLLEMDYDGAARLPVVVEVDDAPYTCEGCGRVCYEARYETLPKRWRDHFEPQQQVLLSGDMGRIVQ